MSARPRFLDEGRIALLELSGRITFGDGDDVIKTLVTQLLEKGCRRVILDFSNVDYMDSSGIDAVVRSYNKLAEVDGRLRLVVTTVRIRSLLDITKLDTVIETFGSRQEALAGF